MSINEIKDRWEDILEEAVKEYNIASVSYNVWLKPLEPIALDKSGDKYLLTLLYQKDNAGIGYLEEKYRFKIQTAVKNILGIDTEIRFVVSVPEAESHEDKKEKRITVPTKSNLDPHNDFDSFVVGNSNNVAHAASLAVAESPGEIYNPLFIYGGVGLGKTHLMQAIALFALNNNPSLKVVYTSCENFINELIDAIRNKNNFSTTEFREKYRNLDILLIDDIQFLSGKESAQEEIFNTFNALTGAGKQIVFASDRPPAEIQDIDERIRSRFMSDLTVDIAAPDFETRVAILRKKQEMDGDNVDNEVITYIASNITSNIRELEGALKRIVVYSKLKNNCEINIAFAEEVLKDSFLNQKTEITPEKIREIVADHFHVSVSDLASEKRNKEIAYPRQIAMYLSCEMTKSPLTTIARVLGKKDHSTIIHGKNKINEEKEKSEELRSTLDILRKKISGA